MTSAELRKKLKKADFISCSFNYFICIFTLIFGLFILKEAILTSGFKKGYLISFCGLFMSIYGFWRIPRDYSVSEILSEQSVAEKEAFVIAISTQLKGQLIPIAHNFYEIRYSGKFGYSLKCTFFFDEKSFLMNISTQRPGFIDFGVSRCATKDMIEKIKERRCELNS